MTLFSNSDSAKRNTRIRAGLPWLLAGAFLLGSATTGGAFAAGLIRSADIVDGQVKRADIADDAVNGAKVQDGTIRSDDLATSRWVDVKPSPGNYQNHCLGQTPVVSQFCGSIVDFGRPWGNFGEGWQPVRFRKDATGAVEIEGLAKNGNSDRTVFILPNAYRPQQAHAFAVTCTSDLSTGEQVAGRMSVYASGHVTWEASDPCHAAGYISLTGIRFNTD